LWRGRAVAKSEERSGERRVQGVRLCAYGGGRLKEENVRSGLRWRSRWGLSWKRGSHMEGQAKSLLGRVKICKRPFRERLI
jgi:hypothetical protein